MTVAALRGKSLQLTKEVPDGCRIIAADGAVRSSKTIGTLLMWVRYTQHGPKGTLAMIGRTETAVINNLILPLQEMLGAKRVVLNRGTGTVSIMGREIKLYGANDLSSVTKIQGLTLAGAYLDEATNVPESFFNMLRSRLSVPGAMLFLTCNPDGPKHWLKVKWLDRAAVWVNKRGERIVNTATDVLPELYRVTFVLRDNHWLVENNLEFVQQLERSWPKGSMFYLRYIESEWVSADGAVYDLWDEARMTISADQIPETVVPLMVAVDYGTNHRTRGYFLGMVHCHLDADGLPILRGSTARPVTRAPVATLVLLAEFSPESATVGQHAKLFEDWMTKWTAVYGEPEWVAVDPAALVFKTELTSRGRVNVMNAHNAVLQGIQTVSSLLAIARLLIVGERCPNLLATLPLYMWDTKATERGETKVRKENDDEADAFRYAVYSSRQYWRDQIPLAPQSLDDSQEDYAA